MRSTSSLRWGIEPGHHFWQAVDGARMDLWYQLTICGNGNNSVGFMMSGIADDCLKTCHNWCYDLSSPYYRAAGSPIMMYGRPHHAVGIALGSNGHDGEGRGLMSVGVRTLSSARPSVQSLTVESVSPQRIPTTGSFSVTINGFGFPASRLSSSISRVLNTPCESSRWMQTIAMK